MESRLEQIFCLREIVRNFVMSEYYRLIQSYLFTAVVVKVCSRGPWEFPKVLSGSARGKSKLFL